MYQTILMVWCVLGATMAQAVSIGWTNWNALDVKSSTLSTGNKNTIHWVDTANAQKFTSESNFAIKTTLTLKDNFAWNDSVHNTGLLLAVIAGDNRYAIQGASTTLYDSVSGKKYENVVKEPGTVIAGGWVHGSDHAWQSAAHSEVVLEAEKSYTLMFTCENKIFTAYVNSVPIGTFDSSRWGDVWALDEITFGTDKDAANLLDGVTTGYYEFSDFQYSMGSSAPEPTTLALLALGVAGVVLRRRQA